MDHVSENCDQILSNRTIADRASLRDKARHWDVIVMTCMLSVVSFVGIVGNALVIAVNRRHRTYSHTLVRFITVMASCDLCVCAVIIPYRIMSYHLVFPFAACKIMELLTYSSVMYSVYVLMVVAVDRYFAVCKPLTFVLTPNKANVIATFIAIVSFISAVPSGIMAGTVISCTSDNSTHTDYTFTGVCNGDGKDYRLIDRDGVLVYSYYLALNWIVLLIVVFIMYSAVFWTIYRRHEVFRIRARKISPIIAEATKFAGGDNTPSIQLQINNYLVGNDNSIHMPSLKRTSHVKAAKLLLLVTVVFVITWIPFLLIKLRAIPNVTVLRMTFFLSNMTNPILYSFTNERFRYSVRRLLKM